MKGLIVKRFMFGIAAGVAAILGITAALAATTVVVTPTFSNWFSADTRAAGTATFEAGPATPPLGIGSLELRTPGAADKVQRLTNLYNGTALSTIDGIGYSTYRDPAATAPFTAGVASINLRVDTNGDTLPDVYMVYEPYQDMGNAAVLTGVWQNWDAYRGGAAKWWINTGAAGCGQATPCTFATIVAALPGATIREGLNCGPAGVTVPCPGSLGVNQGSGNGGFHTNVDALYVSVGGNRTTFDFEPYAVATDKDQCKDGGWQNVRRANGTPFKNQGDCVSYTNNGR
jgi:hypothetical protein